MEKEFDLSKCINKDWGHEFIMVEPIKEFIKIVKEGLENLETPTGTFNPSPALIELQNKLIDKLAGEKLV